MFTSSRFSVLSSHIPLIVVNLGIQLLVVSTKTFPDELTIGLLQKLLLDGQQMDNMVTIVRKFHFFVI